LGIKLKTKHNGFVKGMGTCGSWERNVEILIDFWKSPRFSLTSPLSQEREKLSHPVFTMCGEPCVYVVKIVVLEVRIWLLNIKPCMGQISGTWELLLCEY
jgi:hypothetical protein